MSHLEFHDWAAAEPPADFAKRATRAILTATPKSRTLRLGWLRSPGRLLFAAALVSASAWGALEARTFARAALASDPVPAIAPTIEVAQRWQQAPSTTAQGTRDPGTIADAIVRPAPLPPTVAAPSSEPLPNPPRAPMPPCHCDHHGIVCTCLDE